MKPLFALTLTTILTLRSVYAADLSFVPTRDAQLQKIVEEISSAALKQFAEKKLFSNQLAITLVDVREPTHLKMGNFRGNSPIYPASVVKLFYLAATHRWVEDGKLADSEELRRALKDMIVDSSNDATAYVVDALTGTTSGPELPEAEMKVWGEKRNVVNRYFTSLDYTSINVNQKPWGDAPYGRERLWVGKSYGNRNALTTDATARLLAEIAVRRCVTAERSAEMLKLLERDFSPKTDADDQGHRYTGLGLPPDAKLWSKAGWTSTARHDAAYVQLTDGRKFVLVTFTNNHANDRNIIQFIAAEVVRRTGVQP